MNKVIMLDLERDPFSIKLGSSFFKSPQNLELALFTEELGYITTIYLKFDEQITLEVTHCLQDHVLPREITGEEQVWKITKDKTGVSIFCDHVEATSLVMQEVDAHCREKLSLDVGNVIFVSENRGAFWKLSTPGLKRDTVL
jgi:hypothetical protein